MTSTEINEMLYREINSGEEFERLFPNSDCTNIRLAKGNTKVAIGEMAKWAKKYAHHSTEIALHLMGEDLEETVNNIQDFLYSHFQYKIDESDQLLRSPGCAWSQRFSGIDCKSYSILASTILLNLGIKHYLRRIQQAAMKGIYTHVYVVVPLDQKNANLSKGYYTIDGTIEQNIELPFTKKDDVLMNEPSLEIVGLAAPGLGCDCGGHAPADQLGYYGMAAGETPDDEEQIDVDWFKKTWGTIKDFIGDWQINGWDLSCINSTYRSSETTRDISLVHIPYLEFYLNAVSSATNSTNMEEALTMLDMYLSNAYAYFYRLRHINNWRNCSRDALNEYVRFYDNQYKKIPQLIEMTKLYYDVTSYKESMDMQRPEPIATNGSIGNDIEPGQVIEYNVYEMVPKEGTSGSGGNSTAGGDIGTILLVGGAAAAYFLSKKAKQG